MRTLLIFLVGFTATQCIYAQNIVPNPGFNEYWSCPGTGEHEIGKCKYWYSLMTWGTDSADYFNSCGGSAPGNLYGYQESADHAYLGIEFTRHGGFINYVGTDVPAMEPGATYKVTMLVSRSDSAMYVVDNLGVFFYNNLPDTAGAGFGNDALYLRVPQVNYLSEGYIYDKSSWTTLSGTFVADSAYTKIMVGGFITVSDSLDRLADHYGYLMGYYYLDSVSVEKIASAGVHGLSEGKCLLYPNPILSNASLKFDYQAGIDYKVTINDVCGRIMKSYDHIYSGEVTIDRADMPAGCYYYRLTGGDVVIANGVFRVE